MYANLANHLLCMVNIGGDGDNMPDLNENLIEEPEDELKDMDIFEFDRTLSEIVSKIDATMQKINEQYPEKSENDGEAIPEA